MKKLLAIIVLGLLLSGCSDTKKKETYFKCEFPTATLADKLKLNFIKITNLKNIKNKSAYKNKEIFYHDADFKMAKKYKSITTLIYISDNYLVFEIDDGESSQFYLNRISLSAYVLSGNHRYDFNYHNESQSSTDLRIRGIGMLMKKMYVDLNRGEFMGNCIKISKPKAQI